MARSWAPGFGAPPRAWGRGGRRGGATGCWAPPESLVSPRAQQRAIRASGDSTYRTRVYDIVRRLDWPPEYNERTLSNPFCDGWHGNESELLSSLPDAV